MRANNNLTLLARDPDAVLVPYRPEHVIQYHAWMQDTALQQATASEPLSVEEEFAMQQSWAEDEKKCTFILLDPEFPDTEGTGRHGGAMAGDVNLYWNDHEDPHAAEIEIMVAEPRSRRKGLATQALRVFMAYAAMHLGVLTFRAKIGVSNAASQALFVKLGYQEVGRSEVFREATFELTAPRSSGGEGGARAAEAWQALVKLGGELVIWQYDAVDEEAASSEPLGLTEGVKN